jgi:hypothetical protein
MITNKVELACNGCGKVIDPDIHPRVGGFDQNMAEQLDFCSYACVATWATTMHGVFEVQRAEHMRVTIEQTNATLAAAHNAEQYGIVDAENPTNYRRVADVPLHPLVELVQGHPPTVRRKGEA